MKLIQDSDGVFKVTFATQKGTTGEVNLETSNLEEAVNRVDEMKVEKLETVSSIADLTHQVVTQIVAGKNLTVGDTIDVWVEQVKASRIYSPTTLHANYTFLKAWARDMGLVDKPLSAVQPKDIGDYVNKGDERRSSAVRKLSCIRSFFSFCQDNGYLYRNPAGKTLVKVTYDPFTHEEKEVRERGVFTEDEFNGLIVVSSGFWKAAITIARDTGLRLGDIAKLEWSSFKEGRLIVWTDKANKRVDVSISNAVSTAMGALSETDIRFCFPVQQKIVSDPTRRSLLSVQFSRLCTRAGVTGRSFHCLRHTNATNLIQGGSSMELVAKRLGHSSTITTKGYVHVS